MSIGFILDTWLAVGAALCTGCTYVVEQVNFERRCQSWLFADNCRGMCGNDLAAIFNNRGKMPLLRIHASLILAL